jgi:glyoxylase-like metal-dependent hydrolase (beta-lactamase superfamily II)
VPEPITRELIERGRAFASFIRFQHDPDLLYEGSQLTDWEVIELPGHADGHVGFLRDGVLVGGDHLLAKITPAVGLYPESRPDPLGDYLASLQRTVELAPRIVYPGHGEPLEDGAARAREIIEHHRRRLDNIEDELGTEPRSAFDVSRSVFGDELPPAQRRFAVAETLSHLERLVREGRAAPSGNAGTVTYTGV